MAPDLALADLPAPAEDKCILGAFVADPACDFNDAGGLEAQGTVYDAIPAGAALDGTGKTLHRAPARVSLVAA